MATLSQLDDDGLSRLKVENLQHILETDRDAFGTLVRKSLGTFGSPSLLTVRSMSSEDGTALAQHLERTVIQPIADGRELCGSSVLQARRVVNRILKELPLPPGVDAREAQEDARSCEFDLESLSRGGPFDLKEVVVHVVNLAHLPSDSGADSGADEGKKGEVGLEQLFALLDDKCESKAQNVKHKRQLRLIGPTNNGKSHLARLVAQMWVVSAAATDVWDGSLEVKAAAATAGRWIETKPIKMTTMEEHLWSAREDSADGVRREVWGPLKYLWELAKRHPKARFALILNESNRGGLFNILNGVWWEKRRAVGDELNPERDPPANLALIFTENPATADYSVVGGDDEALRARLGARDTVAVVHGGVDEGTLREYKKLSDGTIPVGSEEMPDGSFKLPDGSTRAPEGKIIDMQHFAHTYCANTGRDMNRLPEVLQELELAADTELKKLPAGEQLRIVSRLPWEYLYVEDRMSFDDHEKKAKLWGGHLVSIESEQENAHVREIAQMGHNFWIGGKRLGKQPTDTPEQCQRFRGKEHWEWTDRTEWGYNNWAEREPNNTNNGTEDRVQMYPDGKWNDVPGAEKLPAVYSKKKMRPGGSGSGGDGGGGSGEKRGRSSPSGGSSRLSEEPKRPHGEGEEAAAEPPAAEDEQ